MSKWLKSRVEYNPKQHSSRPSIPIKTSAGCAIKSKGVSCDGMRAERAKESNGNADWPRFTPWSTRLTSVTEREESLACFYLQPAAKLCIYAGQCKKNLAVLKAQIYKQYMAEVKMFTSGHNVRLTLWPEVPLLPQICRVIALFLRHLNWLECHSQVWQGKGVGSSMLFRE